MHKTWVFCYGLCLVEMYLLPNDGMLEVTRQNTSADYWIKQQKTGKLLRCGCCSGDIKSSFPNQKSVLDWIRFTMNSLFEDLKKCVAQGLNS